MKSQTIKAVARPESQSRYGVSVELWWIRFTTRRQLDRMLEQEPERLYTDLGLDEFAIRQECSKWFWQI